MSTSIYSVSVRKLKEIEDRVHYLLIQTRELRELMTPETETINKETPETETQE